MSQEKLEELRLLQEAAMVRSTLILSDSELPLTYLPCSEIWAVAVEIVSLQQLDTPQRSAYTVG